MKKKITIIFIVSLLVIVFGFAYEMNNSLKIEKVDQRQTLNSNTEEEKQKAEFEKQARGNFDEDEVAGEIFKSTKGNFSWRINKEMGIVKVFFFDGKKETFVFDVKSPNACVVENLTSPLTNNIKKIELPIIKCSDGENISYITKIDSEIELNTTKEKCQDFSTCKIFLHTEVLLKM